jgi:hypothetical protein
MRRDFARRSLIPATLALVAAPARAAGGRSPGGAEIRGVAVIMIAIGSALAVWGLSSGLLKRRVKTLYGAWEGRDALAWGVMACLFGVAIAALGLAFAFGRL